MLAPGDTHTYHIDLKTSNASSLLSPVHSSRLLLQTNLSTFTFPFHITNGKLTSHFKPPATELRSTTSMTFSPSSVPPSSALLLNGEGEVDLKTITLDSEYKHIFTVSNGHIKSVTLFPVVSDSPFISVLYVSFEDHTAGTRGRNVASSTKIASSNDGEGGHKEEEQEEELTAIMHVTAKEKPAGKDRATGAQAQEKPLGLLHHALDSVTLLPGKILTKYLSIDLVRCFARADPENMPRLGHSVHVVVLVKVPSSSSSAPTPRAKRTRSGGSSGT